MTTDNPYKATRSFLAPLLANYWPPYKSLDDDRRRLADSQFDRAADARRQAGSSWKPFVYLTAMENGFTPDTPVIDEPIKIGDWEPHNFTGKYLGPINIQTAKARISIGVAATTFSLKTSSRS